VVRRDRGRLDPDRDLEYSDEYGPGGRRSSSENPLNADLRVFKLRRSYASTATRDSALQDYSSMPNLAEPVT
jgi:hypothetical protein